jgi:signal transduction histidine kinase
VATRERLGRVTRGSAAGDTPAGGGAVWPADLLREAASRAAEGATEEQLLPLLAARLRERCPAEAAFVVVSTDEEDRFRVAGAAHDAAAIGHLVGRSYRRAGSYVERALREGIQRVGPDPRLEPGTVLDAVARAVPFRLALIAPFRTAGMGEGAVMLLNPVEETGALEACEDAAAVVALLLGAVGGVFHRTSADEMAALGDEAAAKLARTHRLAALGELAAGVAHDLNNALNPIVSYAELLVAAPGDADQVRLYAGRILLAATDGAETVRRIQGLTRRRGALRPAEPVLLAATCREAVDLSRPTWAERQRGGRIEASISVDATLRIRAVPSEVREILLNLINNSLDAMPEGGTLRIVGRREADVAVLAVQDTGVGMTPEVRERALEPFFTTKGAGGTGLGLSEVRSIVRRHGGRVEIESWPGIGTTVLMRFREAQPDPAAEELQAPRPSPAGRPRRILLVDDNVLNAEALAASLRAAGHVVTTADSGEAALELFQRNRYSLVIADVGLPGMNGFELVEALRRVDPRVRVGLVTGWMLEEDAAQIAARGISFVLIKPVSAHDLLAQI